MIKETYVDVTLAAGLIKHLKKCGYELPTHTYRGEEKVTVNTKIRVRVEHLLANSHAKVTRVCDKCHDERVLRFEKYTDLCRRCAIYKISERLRGPSNGMYGRRGELSPRWNPEKTNSERLLGAERFTSKESIRWAKDVKRAGNFTCLKCGQLGGKLVSHHIESWCSNVDLRFVLSNGACLCQRCHFDFHKVFGKKNNNRLQFQEFLGEQNG